MYGTAKAAINQFTRWLAAEIGEQGVRVNTVAPGITETDMVAPYIADPAVKQAFIDQVPFCRLGTPEDIARVVLFFLGNDAGWVTGRLSKLRVGFRF